MKDSHLHAHIVVKISNLVISLGVVVMEMTSKIFLKIRAARAARLFTIFKPMISLFCDVVVVVAVVVS